MTQSNRQKQINLNSNWKFKETFPKISAYTTTFNCVEGNYPFEEAIKSFAWADEIVVADGGSTDGTRERLETLQKELPSLVVYDIPLSGEPGQDGELKAMSRAMITNDFAIQFDCDEICVGAIDKWKKLAKNFPDNQIMQELIVLEPIGSLTNLRLNDSHNNLKWRFSRNEVSTTHGIPDYDRVEKDGKVWSSGKSDGCFPVHIVTNKLVPSFAQKDEREAATLKREHKTEEYKQHIESLIKDNHPMILHLGHVKLQAKISLYLKSWHQWWNNLYQKNENVYFPGIAISDVTEDMINAKIKEIIKETPSVQIPEIEQLCHLTNIAS